MALVPQKFGGFMANVVLVSSHVDLIATAKARLDLLPMFAFSYFLNSKLC